LIRDIRLEPWAESLPEDAGFWTHYIQWIEENLLPKFLERFARKIDEIVDIDPDLSEQQILEKATSHMVSFLGATSASIRIYDPKTEQMLSYGSYPSREKTRETAIPLEDSISGEVLRTRQTYFAPNLLKEELYHNKRTLVKEGLHSLMAIPFEIPRFFPRERDTLGVIQLYYGDGGRKFSSLEIRTANTMAKRLSFVMAHKKILSMNRIAEKREDIVNHIFLKLGSRGGVKLAEVFNEVVPELADMVDLQSCALFSVGPALDQVVLQAGFPLIGGYHSVGKAVPVSSEPVYELLLNLRGYSGDSRYEEVTPFYILIVDVARSSLMSENNKRFARRHGINSVLFIPLKVAGEITHFMTFDALDYRKRYREEEIGVFLFLGRELMKAQKMEQLDDALHDFKNPAIATAGFARRLKSLIQKDDLESSREQIQKYVDILLDETSRLQELAMGVYAVGEEQVVDFSRMVQKRFEINKEAIKELLKQDVALKQGPYDGDLRVKCHSVHLERVFDNLLNNATKAIPLKGGVLAVQTYAKGEWACAEISNSGEMSEQDQMKSLEGAGEGRGLYITYRILRLLNGKMDIRSENGVTTFVVSLPLYSL
ncbi:MAG: GAF domain-containing protein, partial [Deltaproteobacteria bacterium]|nr:GAF domain-containing protein [Deltaproteobacteria bacterium]